jgi:hypothetical protein
MPLPPVNQKRKKLIRVVSTWALTVLLFVIIHFILPPKGSTTGLRLIFKNLLFAMIFGFLPYYILPWLRKIMGHENDGEEKIESGSGSESGAKVNKTDSL